MLEPWAEVSERLRRVDQKSKLMQYLDYRLAYVSKITASKGARCSCSVTTSAFRELMLLKTIRKADDPFSGPSLSANVFFSLDIFNATSIVCLELFRRNAKTCGSSPTLR